MFGDFIHAFDLETAQAPRWISRITPDAFIHYTDIAIKDGYAFITDSNHGLTVLDMRGLLSTNLRLDANESGPAVSWDLGTLRFSLTVNGPWTDVPGASSFRLSPIGDKGFFRVKVPPSLLELRRTGPTSAEATAGRDE